MPDKTKFEREIDEILEKSESSKGASKPRRKQRRQFEPFSPVAPKQKPPTTSTPISSIVDPGYMVLAGIVVLIIAAVSPAATSIIAIAGIALVAIGFILWFRTGASAKANLMQGGGGQMWNRNSDQSTGSQTTNNEPEVKYWRGQRIESKPDNPTKSDRSDRGKIIDFGSPNSNDDDDDRNPGGKNRK